METTVKEKQIALQLLRVEGYDNELKKTVFDNLKALHTSEYKGVFDIDERAYHAGVGFSRSQLMDAVHRTPFYFKWRHLDSQPDDRSTKSMDFGDLIHTGILEPDRIAEKFCSDEKVFESLIKEGYKNPRSTKAYDEWRSKQGGKTIMAYEDFESLKTCVQRIWDHPVASKLMRDGHAEKAIFAQDPVTGLLCRGKPDFIMPDGALIDVKTTMPGSEDDWESKLYNMGYHVQAALYLMIAEWMTGRKFNDYLYVVIDNKQPHEVQIKRLDDGTRELGELTVRKALDTVADCIRNDAWPSYGNRIVDTGVPHWAFNKNI